MLRTSFLSGVALALLASFLTAAPAPAQQPGEEVTGVIKEVDLQGSGPRSVTIMREDGAEMKVTIANRTRVVFRGGDYPNADLNYLKPGLAVRFKYDPGTIERIHVESVPPGYEPPAYANEPAREAQAAGRAIKARLLDTSPRAGDFAADVAGRRESFRLKDPAMMQSFRRGDLVILTLEGAPGTEVVTEIRSAALSGRVTSVDRRRNEVTIDVEGRTEAYGVNDEKLLRNLRVGDRVRFEFEERRGGHKVITTVF